MDLQDDFRKDVWIVEAQKFVDASHEHLLFGKALARSQQQQAKKKREAAIANAKSQFAQLPKDLQLDLIVESKVSSMMKGNGKVNPALKQSMSEPLFAKMHQAKTEFMRDHGKFFGLPRLPYGKGHGKGHGKAKSLGRGNHSRHPSSSARSTSQQSAKAKGKGKGKKGFSRSSSRQSALIHMKGKGKKKGYQNKGKGKGKNKGKNGKSNSSWRLRSRSTTPFNPRMKWGAQGVSRAHLSSSGEADTTYSGAEGAKAVPNSETQAIIL